MPVVLIKKSYFRMASLLLLLMVCWPHPAQANCSWSGGQTGPSRYLGTTSTISLNVLNSAVGQRLSDIGGMSGTPSWNSNCVGNESSGYTNEAGPISPVLTQSEKGPIYGFTQVPGIGYTLSDSNLYNGSNNYFRPYGSLSAPGGQFYFDASNKVRVDFWKTGNTTAGHYCLPAGTRLGNVKFGTLVVFEASLSNGLCIDVQGATCSVATASKNITVPLGSYSVNQFSGNNRNTTSHPFNIELQNCNQVQQVDVEFIATADPNTFNGAINGIVQLEQSAGHASGIAVQLLNAQNTPLGLNQKISVWRGNQNSVTLPFAVRYLKTSSQITPGHANAMMQFMVSYQ